MPNDPRSGVSLAAAPLAAGLLAAALLAAGLLAPAAAQERGLEPTPEGLWQGAILYDPGKLEIDVVVELASSPDGSWVGTIDVLPLGVQFQPLEKVSVDGSAVEFWFNRESPTAGRVESPFRGELSADGSTLQGEFVEGGQNPHPFVLRRIGEAGAERSEPQPAELHPLGADAAELRDAFNRDRDRVRAVLLLSPSCPVCIRSARMLRRYLLEGVDAPDLRVYVVWGPMLDKETEADAAKASVILPDPRAVHFWTASDGVADLFQKRLGFTDPEELGWDTYHVYARGAAWEEELPPAPDAYMHINKPLPEDRQLDAVAFAEEVARRLAGEETGGGGTDGEAPAPGGAAPPPPPSASLELAPCELPRYEGEARCGTLAVPEDRSAAGGRTIGLRLAVLPATGGARQPEPLLVLAGGPGQSAVQAAFLFAATFADSRAAGRDLVLVDQRGTGGSNPLRCPFPGDDDDPQSYLGDQMPAAALEACLGSLEADPRHYTTPATVADLEAVRSGLGYPRLDLYGLSYGSRVALDYLRRHPERVRSAILAGVVPPDMAIPTHHAPDAQRALDLLFDECAADPECAAAYPGLREKFWAVWERLGEGPVEVTLTDPKTEREVTVTLDRDLFNEEIRWRLYDHESNLVPPLVARAHEGDFREIAALLLRLRRAVAAGAILATGMFMSVTCAEDVPFIDLEEAGRLAEGTFLGTYRVEQQRAACAVWPRGEVPAGFTEPVRSDAPILILSGYRDPVTPPKWGEHVLPHLPNARHVVLRQGFHAGMGDCEQALMNRFLAAGSAAGLDASCAERMPETPFVMPDDEVPVD